jgi:uncharacterized protein YbaR (Trm112 family)
MVKSEGVEIFSLDKTEDRLLLVAFVCVLLSLYFGLQPGLLFVILWAGTGIGALICIYFAFPNMWPYSLILYATYGISAFGVILLIFWYDVVIFFGISIAVLVGIFFIAAAFYIAFYIVKNVKKTRDASAKKRNYLPLGFWSISVMLFPLFSVLSIFSWSIWVDSGELQFYLILEPLIAILLVYILWLPDRNIDWSIEHLPEPPVTRLIAKKSKVLKEKVTRVKNICPECGLKLKMERKSCPSCDNTQTFGWCVTSEAYVLPCPHCGKMVLYGKEKCDECGKTLSDSIACESCKKTFPIKEWVAQKV